MLARSVVLMSPLATSLMHSYMQPNNEDILMDQKYDGVELECQVDPMGSVGWTSQVRIKGGKMLALGATSVSRSNAEAIGEEQLKRWQDNLKKNT